MFTDSRERCEHLTEAVNNEKVTKRKKDPPLHPLHHLHPLHPHRSARFAASLSRETSTCRFNDKHGAEEDRQDAPPAGRHHENRVTTTSRHRGNITSPSGSSVTFDPKQKQLLNTMQHRDSSPPPPDLLLRSTSTTSTSTHRETLWTHCSPSEVRPRHPEEGGGEEQLIKDEDLLLGWKLMKTMRMEEMEMKMMKVRYKREQPKVGGALVCFVAQMETGRLKTGSHRAADRKQ